MSDEQVGAGQPQQGQQDQQTTEIQIRDPGKATHYANFFTATGGQDGVMISFGNLFGTQPVVTLESKVVLSLKNAKRLALSLGQFIRQYEERYGEIDISVAKRQQEGQPPEATGGLPTS